MTDLSILGKSFKENILQKENIKLLFVQFELKHLILMLVFTVRVISGVFRPDFCKRVSCFGEGRGKEEPKPS